MLSILIWSFKTKNATWCWCEPTCHCLEHSLIWEFTVQTWWFYLLDLRLAIACKCTHTFWDVNYFLVRDRRIESDTYELTVHKHGCAQKASTVVTFCDKPVGRHYTLVLIHFEWVWIWNNIMQHTCSVQNKKFSTPKQAKNFFPIDAGQIFFAPVYYGPRNRLVPKSYRFWSFWENSGPVLGRKVFLILHTVHDSH